MAYSSQGQNFKTQAGKDSYDDYIEMYNFFVENGKPELANQLTQRWNDAIPVAGGSAKVIENFTPAVTNVTNQISGAAGLSPMAAANGLKAMGTTLASDQGTGGKALDVASQGAGLATLAGIGGAAMPVIGAGLALGKGFYDYKQQQEAIKNQNIQAERVKNMRDFANAKYMDELDSDSARREMYFRGQMAQSPQYQAAMSQGADRLRLNDSIMRDQLEKRGLGEKSGLFAQMSSQNFGNLSKDVGKAVKDSVNTQRAYTGLKGMAQTTQPEQMRYNQSGQIYQDNKDYIDYAAPTMDYLNTQGEGLRRYSDEYQANEQLRRNKGL